MQARLVIVRGEGSPQICDLNPRQPITLGRSRDNHIILRDEHASRQHARVYFEDGDWFIRDLKTRNGTRVNAQRLQDEQTFLRDGHEIVIAGMHLLFQLGDAPAPRPTLHLVGTTPPSFDSSRTVLEADELVVLHGFMTEAIHLTTAAALIQRTLSTLALRTRATLVGFLGLDEEQPLPKMLYPEKVELDYELSRQLTRRVQKSGTTVWLKTEGAEIDQSESLRPFQDAICVPLLAEGEAFGALHVYRNGRYFTERELRFCEVLSGFAASCLERLRRVRSLEAENARLRVQAAVSERLVGASPALQELERVIAKVAPSKATVLLHGETGSGKELVAQELHRRSPRREAPFVAVNCSAIAPSLLESELFGHCKGAFTGATRYRPGLFEQADGGTLFLDEIGDMSLDCQAKMLRVLEGKGFRPVGETCEIQTDVRVIAATHRDLAREVRAEKFREDLYYRLRVICITVPPLREHQEDIPDLVEHFLERFAAEMGRRKHVSAEALRHLTNYTWPGNVRELRTTIERAVILSEGDRIGPNDLRLQEVLLREDLPESWSMKHVEAWAIRQALRKTGWNISQAAQVLEISRETLATKIKKYELSRDIGDAAPDATS